MSNKYSHLLSPIAIGNVVLKNRMGMPRAVPTFASGVECDTPNDTLVYYLGNLARNGAAIVTCPSPKWENSHSKPRPMPPGVPGGAGGPGGHGVPGGSGGSGGHGAPGGSGGKKKGGPDAGFDYDVTNTKILYARCIEAIHAYGSLACISLMDIEPANWAIDDIPEAYLDEMVADFAAKCKLYKDYGFDMCSFYMSYGNSLLAKSMSFRLNHRTDKYAGATALSRAVFSAVRKACGKDFLIEIQVSGEGMDGGYSVDDFVAYLRAVEDLVDIAQIRCLDMDLAHPTGFNSVKGDPITIHYAEKAKEAGVNIVIAPVGGFQNPDENEEYLRTGKADMIYMARAFLCDSHYLEKIRAGRGEDVIPCVRCNKCHVKPGDSNAGCVVNPELSLNVEPAWLCRVQPEAPFRKKKVAVIGGGPAGMEAALVAAKRGHQVTLYEKKDVLGGQLLHSDFVSFKWPLRDFKNYLVAQIEKNDVKVCLGTLPTPEELAAEGFDAILYAAGAVPAMPSIHGIHERKVWNPLQVFGNEDKLGKDIVVIGGAETGAETAIHLAVLGHNVVGLSRNRTYCHDGQKTHYLTVVEDFYKKLPNFRCITGAITTEITSEGVTYMDGQNQSHTIHADDVVVCGGMKPDNGDALGYASAADEFYLIGDCKHVGDLRRGLKSAYTTAMLL